ncbi:mucin-3B-like, partial [Neopelma chrysocephalum]|uniref:mucin-3B-like n=1 Tax=Neopelma chrysocephalum TaxID=114329 RepID=UPI000FCD18BB
ANGTVQVNLRVVNRNFTDELNDNNSPEYKEFVKNFTEQMYDVYKAIEGYRGIEVQRLSPGSVVVHHTVIVALPVTTQSQEKLHNVTVDLRQKVEAVLPQFSCEDELCFNSTDISVAEDRIEFNETAHCQSEVPERYWKFFFPNLTSSGLTCVSNCTPGTAGTFDCHRGTCRVTEGGPLCFCDETNLYWYQGNRCASRVSKLGVGLGVAVAVLAVTVAVLAFFLFRARRSHLSHGERMMMDQWYQDSSEEWDRPGSITFHNRGAQLEDDDDAFDRGAVELPAPVRIPRPREIVTEF